MKIKQNSIFRPATTDDVPALAGLHTSAIMAGGASFYTRAERESWAAGLDAAFYTHALAKAALFEVVADAEGALLALGATRGHEVWLLYTDGAAMGQGIGGALLARLEADIAARGHAVMTVRSSLNAEGFYARRGWRAVEYFGHRTRGGLVLGAVRMEKPAPGALSRG